MQELIPFDLQFFAKKEDGETPPPTKAKGKKKRETAGPKKSRSSSSRKKKKTSDFTDDELIRYVVQPGDTIYNLARRFHTTPRRICELNKLHKPTLLIPGDVIVLPENF
ncbi:MAG: LysM peptidoglycan-binding domain-containing protein [Firmicutes bacterium]|nr:LysM peptidoglycan-binding domain-containing protein [Bacillota bacterium]